MRTLSANVSVRGSRSPVGHSMADALELSLCATEGFGVVAATGPMHLCISELLCDDQNLSLTLRARADVLADLLR